MAVVDPLESVDETKFSSPTYVGKICRSCLCEVHKDYFSLEGYYLEKKILNMYKNVISIEVDSDENFPKKLCAKCYDNIIRFDIFKSNALKSEKILADNLKSTSNVHGMKNDTTESFNVKKIEGVDEYCDGYHDYSRWLNSSLNSQEYFPVLETLDIENTKDTHHKDVKALQVLLKNDEESEDSKTDLKQTLKGDINVVSSQENCVKKRKRKKEPCKLCEKLIYSYKMDCHMRTHTKEKPFGCDECGATFTQKSNLQRHIKIHGNDRPFKCAYCYKGFLRPSSRLMHETTAHNTVRNVLCSLCGKAFKHKYFLNKHMANIHNKKEEEINLKGEETGFQCPTCGNFYKTKSSLTVHRMIHEHPKAFLCNICGKGFSTKAVLENHEKIHTGEKNFSCDICQKKFRFIGTLKTHVLTHSGAKPLSCHICNKKFRQHSHLNTHIRGQHSVDRPYQCSFCPKTFKNSSNMTVHIRTHTGETPHHCDICQKGFYDSSRLKKHKKSHFNKMTSVTWHRINRVEENAMQTVK